MKYIKTFDDVYLKIEDEPELFKILEETIDIFISKKKDETQKEKQIDIFEEIEEEN